MVDDVFAADGGACETAAGADAVPVADGAMLAKWAAEEAGEVAERGHLRALWADVRPAETGPRAASVGGEGGR